MKNQALGNNNENLFFFLAGLTLGSVGFFFLHRLGNTNRIQQKIQPSPKNNFDFKQIVFLKRQKLNNSKQFIIVANGPFLPIDIIREAAANKTIVALEGAADKLAVKGIMPDIILGDFDSIKNPKRWGILKTFNEIDEKSPPYLGHHEVTIVPAKDQQYTDFQKAIRYCDEQNAEVIDIVCATGGRMDHTLSNLRTLRTMYKRKRRIYLHTESQTLQFATPGTYHIHGEKGQHCGVMAFPAAKFTSKGLVYNGNSYPLIFGTSESTSNLLEQSSAEVIIEEGEALLIMPGMLKAHQVYNKESKIDKVHCFFKSKQVVVSTNISLLEKTFGKDANVIIAQLRKDFTRLTDSDELLATIPESFLVSPFKAAFK